MLMSLMPNLRPSTDKIVESKTILHHASSHFRPFRNNIWPPNAGIGARQIGDGGCRFQSSANGTVYSLQELPRTEQPPCRGFVLLASWSRNGACRPTLAWKKAKNRDSSATAASEFLESSRLLTLRHSCLQSLPMGRELWLQWCHNSGRSGFGQLLDIPFRGRTVLIFPLPLCIPLSRLGEPRLRGEVTHKLLDPQLSDY